MMGHLGKFFKRAKYNVPIELLFAFSETSSKCPNQQNPRSQIGFWVLRNVDES